MADIIDSAIAEAEARERKAVEQLDEAGAEPITTKSPVADVVLSEDEKVSVALSTPRPNARPRKSRASHLIPHGKVTKDATYHDIDWEHSPLARALACLSDFKRAYESASQIVLRRQTTAPRMLTCWAQLHKSKVAKSVVAQCRGQIPDGKWVFRDDGAFIIKDGVRVSEPAVCCSMLCYTHGYQLARTVSGLSRH
jgi:hypothetical protein